METYEREKSCEKRHRKFRIRFTDIAVPPNSSSCESLRRTFTKHNLDILHVICGNIRPLSLRCDSGLDFQLNSLYYLFAAESTLLNTTPASDPKAQKKKS